jgi:hypothetical protein
VAKQFDREECMSSRVVEEGLAKFRIQPVGFPIQQGSYEAAAFVFVLLS